MGDPSPSGPDLAVLIERMRSLERKIADLAAPSGTQRALAVQTLQEQQEQLAEQVAFLQTQTVFATSLGEFEDISSGLTVWPFNATYDLELTVTSGDAGKLWVTVGAWMYGFERSPILGVDASWDGGSIAFDPINYRRHATGSTDVAAQRSYMLTVPARTAVTVRTRRGATNTAARQITLTNQTLSVTRLA